MNSPEYLEVKDSSSLQQFGSRLLSTPGSKAQLKSRQFIDLLSEEVLARKATCGDGKTLDGISTKFQYICSVRKLIVKPNIVLYTQVDGTVFWRRYPCFCTSCVTQDWENCGYGYIVGDLTVVKKA